jgi:hypothetical protein
MDRRTPTPTRQLALAVVADARRLIPWRAAAAAVAGVCLPDLGAVHGRYDRATGWIALNRRLFGGDLAHVIDIDGEAPARRRPAVARALHTYLHEWFHALGAATGLDESFTWLLLSGWERARDNPPGTGRYVERRPGWPPGPSPWRYRRGTCFPRAYSAKSPYEDFADCGTYLALGWTRPFGLRGYGQAKRRYLAHAVWGTAAHPRARVA